MADETYPDDLKYHPEHDWARIDGDQATFGITWYAQDALGEVVFFDPPEVARRRQGLRLRGGRVGEGRLRRDRAALGRGVEVNEALDDSPEAINEDPYGERLAGQGEAQRSAEADSLLAAAATASCWRTPTGPVRARREAIVESGVLPLAARDALYVRNRRRPRADARRGRGRLDRRALRRVPSRRAP